MMHINSDHSMHTFYSCTFPPYGSYILFNIKTLEAHVPKTKIYLHMYTVYTMYIIVYLMHY